ncbi:hypothetical protein CBS101457_001715 [Exobasidium rhododendri]|nr:hypothetical protein CBS101457_001715 [Exobasidium rhododendri]
MSEARRADKHTKARQQMMEEFERQKAELVANTEKNSKAPSDRFTSKTDSIEETLKKSTIGLVSAEDFKKRREELEEHKRREAAQTDELRANEKAQKKKNKKESKSKLSFAMYDEEDDDGDSFPTTKKAKREVAEIVKKNNLKNPAVDTSFLPDRDREEQDRLAREELRQDWLRKQEIMKAESIEIVYSYWDGSGHRKSLTCKKGDTIAVFLEKCRQQVSDLRGISVDSMMYIKEDLIIPHHYSFYDFIVNKARGKSGPLFNFDVHDDVRLLADATVEKDESHAGKVVERSWYNRNKHIFPASRWDVYEPGKELGNYSIHDRKS